MTRLRPDRRPILVCMVWRGGQRFERCLSSIESGRSFFSRVVISVAGSTSGKDMRNALAAHERDPSIEVICPGRELPTMQHQDFWITYLGDSGTLGDDWVCWLAYDDELRTSGLAAVTRDGSWPLDRGNCYFGPWAMRHEDADHLWTGDADERLESWTSFPIAGPTRLPVSSWIGYQLAQPTYMQMSGSVNPFSAFVQLKGRVPRKKGPMRIEMAVAAQSPTTFVAEFSEPISIIYGRSNSDRASYGRAARQEDLHLLTVLGRRILRHPQEFPDYVRGIARSRVKFRRSTVEEWRVRSIVSP